MASTRFVVDYTIWIAMAVLYLLLGASSVAVAYKTRSSPISQLRQQVYAWWIIFPVVSLSIFIYPYGCLALILLISCLAIRELVRYHQGPRPQFWVICLALLGLVLALTYYQPRSVSLLLPLLIIAQLAYFSLRRESNQLLLLLFLLSCFGLSFLIQLTHLPLPADTNLAWLFYLFTLTALNDIAQFVSGKCLGTKQIAKRISPNKTWQGLAGGVVISVLVSVTLGSFLQLATMPYLCLLALLLSLGGFAGDLLFSAGKRFLHIKDYSQLIPGHGGILDRVDSLIVTAPLLYQVIYFSHDGFI